MKKDKKNATRLSGVFLLCLVESVLEKSADLQTG